MRNWMLVVAGLFVATPLAEAADSDLCGPLRRFVESVKPDETRRLEFHTSWGADFKDSAGAYAMSARRCMHFNYGPAKVVCAYLMEHGATEFAGNNAKDAIRCLSKTTRFADRLMLDGIQISFSYGSDERGSNIELQYSEDRHLGGMVLSITASGY